jgi:hypothetical protein
MNVLGSLATASLLVCAMGCAPVGEDEPPEETPAEDQPLDVTVDSLDVVHGALRLQATMVDGAADVSVRLGGDCAHREIGGGLSTRSTLVWLLRDDDLVEAMACGLVVRARARESSRYVNRVAELPVTVDVAALEGETADDGPELQSVTMSPVGAGVVFAHVSPGARLTTGDSILEAAPPASGEDEPSADTARFDVPGVDLARSALRGGRLRLDGSYFGISLSVGGTSLDGEPRDSDRPQLEPALRAPRIQPDDEAPADPPNPEWGSGEP